MIFRRHVKLICTNDEQVIIFRYSSILYDGPFRHLHRPLTSNAACMQHACSMQQTMGVWGMLPQEILILDLLLDVIWWNLGLFLRNHNLPFIVSLYILLIYM